MQSYFKTTVHNQTTTSNWDFLLACAYIASRRVNRPNPLSMGEGRQRGGQRKGCRPTPPRSRSFLSCVPSFPFFLFFYVRFPEIINYVWKEGTRTLGRTTGTRVSSVDLLELPVLFFTAFHALVRAAVSSWRLHRIIPQKGGPPTHRYK